MQLRLPHDLVDEPYDGPLSRSRPQVVPIPNPPAEYKGTELEWRMMNVPDPSRVAHDALDTWGDLERRDRLAVLRGLRRDPSADNAKKLLAMRAEIPDDPAFLSEYSITCATTLKAVAVSLARDGETLRAVTAETLDGEGGELLRMVLEIETRKAMEYTPYLSQQAWGGVRRTLRQVENAAPGYQSSPALADSFDQLRTAVEQVLEAAAVPRPGYRGGLEAIRVGSDIADEGTCEVFLNLLRYRDNVRQKLDPPTVTSMLVFMDHAASTIVRYGSVAQQLEFADLIRSELATEKEGRTRSRLWRYARLLAKSKKTDAKTRDVIKTLTARSPAEERLKAETGRILNRR